jgi:hypothetical protein
MIMIFNIFKTMMLNAAYNKIYKLDMMKIMEIPKIK